MNRLQFPPHIIETMSLKVVLIILAINTFGLSSASLRQNLINDYLKENNLKYCIFAVCPNETINLNQFLSINPKVYSNAYDIERGSFSVLQLQRLFYYVNHPVGVILDLKCENVSGFLGAMSNLTMFHLRYYWIMLSDNLERATDLLRRQRINVDAEITLAVPQNG